MLLKKFTVWNVFKSHIYHRTVETEVIFRGFD